MIIDSILPAFSKVVIRRSGGFAGLSQTLTVDQSLKARVDCSHSGERAFQLDAHASQELMQALVRVATEQPKSSPAQGADMFTYDIELSWSGKTYRISSVDVGADDALHGVMFAANRLMAPSYQQPIHVMSLHDVPRPEPARAAAPSDGNGNGGIVPPWLQ